MNARCEGCGTELADGGVDLYCPNVKCDYDQRKMFQMVRQSIEARERKEYQRLKAIYEKG